MNLREQFISSGTLLSWMVAVKKEQGLLRTSLLLVQVAQPARESMEHLRKCKAFNVAAWCKESCGQLCPGTCVEGPATKLTEEENKQVTRQVCSPGSTTGTQV